MPPPPNPRLRRHRIEDAVWLGHPDQLVSEVLRAPWSATICACLLNGLSISRSRADHCFRLGGGEDVLRPAGAFMRDQLVQRLCDDEIRPLLQKGPYRLRCTPGPAGAEKEQNARPAKRDPRFLLEHDDLAPDGCELRRGTKPAKPAVTTMASHGAWPNPIEPLGRP
jgi:hypothetical protein